ncbi:glutathione synthase [Hyphomonas sp. FCG-A18]|uniref:glutathione synthase n=1 Tax=Hyphomonas sp. FCG-A18 TaxID=3080019 RepID=UPI002B2FB0BD|nr:glutathione synthase [Hyphomonas sp. FCG-A18]
MTLRVAIQTDPLETANVESNTTFALAEAAQKIGAELFEYQPEDLSYNAGRITAWARPLKVQRVPGTPAIFSDRRNVSLQDDIDVVLMRQDPPFDMSYITACHILELLKGQTLVLNDPEHVRSGPEKLYPMAFQDFMPPTLISRDRASIGAFREEHKDVIVKPLYGFGGGDVFHVKPGDNNFGPLIDLFLGRTREPLIVQAFLPAVAAGDKRIILINGEAVGGFNRVPQKGHARSNLAVGGTAEASELSEADLAICAAIGPDLKAKGQVLVGIDVIGGYLTEVNNTSPTGVQQVRDFTGRDPAAMFWETVQEKLAST